MRPARDGDNPIAVIARFMRNDRIAQELELLDRLQYPQEQRIWRQNRDRRESNEQIVQRRARVFAGGPLPAEERL